jgi:hypothetical protein
MLDGRHNTEVRKRNCTMTFTSGSQTTPLQNYVCIDARKKSI